MKDKLKKNLQDILNNNDFNKRLTGEDEAVPEINALLKKIFNLNNKYHVLEKSYQKEITRARQLNHILCHDLLAPLSAMKTTLGVLHLTPEEEKEQLIHILNRSLDRSLSMIEDVRNYLQVDEGKLELKLEFFNAGECIAEAIEVLNHKLVAKEIKMNISVEKDLEVLIYKSSFINSVLVNILSNAIKFSPRAGEIKVDAYHDCETALIQIRDCGIGMSENIRENLFSVSEATSRIGTEGEMGTGFGMPIVKKFIESFEGDIEIESWEKNLHPNSSGTLVTIYLWRDIKKKIAI